MANKKRSYGIISFGVLLAVIYFTALYLNIQQKKELHRNGILTTGTIYDVGFKYFKVRYFVNGETYTSGEKEPFQYIKEGEEFEVKYNVNDPSELIIYYDRPVFSRNYQYGQVDCNSLKKTMSKLTFTYYVDKRRYTRNTYFREGQSLDKLNYLVKYRLNNPDIGYLRSD